MLEKAIPFRVIRCFDETIGCRAGVRRTDSTLGQVSVEEPEPGVAAWLRPRLRDRAEGMEQRQ